MDIVTLFCLPYAGGSASIYHKWRRHLDESIELIPLELSGRGSRIKEPLYNSIENAVEDIYNQIQPFLNKPFSIFGHSMGSLLAYELSCKIKQKDGIEPVHLFVSGRKAPNCPERSPIEKKKIHLLPDDEFVEVVKSLGGTPDGLLDNSEYLDFFKPILRADFRMIETYKYDDRDFKLNCDITVLNGKEDDIAEEELAAWGPFTNGNSKIVEFNGGHFFINHFAEPVVRLINEEIKENLVCF
ncbi:thioesterase domain-containing protein [Bacillus cereus]|uniref:alpha/beta fold hydrolase n=1 Tax=Bacillus cereus TaxID=1396 RepID=UPI001247D5FF|nr:thioesterase II family protein [Bacillus cereus]MCU5475468.1 thioesterase domain-containing protein [Bacillus cereus]MCU5614903.1 thioesterase domain-containing protein [Bacillus cereus]